MTEPNVEKLGVSDRRRRLAGPQKLKYNGKDHEMIPFVSNNPAIVDVGRTWVIDKTELFSDDILKTALDCCNSVRDPSPYIKTLGNALLLAMDARSVKRHGYSASPAEREYKVDYEAMLGDRDGFLQEMAELYDEIAALYGNDKKPKQ